MSVVALDTYEVVKELKAAGFEERQAEALSRILKLSRDVDLSHIATKADIQELGNVTRTDLEALRVSTKIDVEALRIGTKTDLDALRIGTKTDLDALRISTTTDLDALRVGTKGDLRELELRLDAKIEASKYEIIKWMFGTVGFQTLVVVGALLALLRGVLHP